MSRHGDGERGVAAIGGGVVGRVVDRAVANPAATGGLLVMALTAGAIAVNATFLQPNDRPRPHLAPHDAVHASAQASTVPTPTPRPGEVATAALPPPLPLSAFVPPANIPAPAAKLAPGKAAPAPQPVSSQAATDTTLIADTQRELVRLGLYKGTVDGVAGPRTKAAISAYQKAAGVPVTGAPSSGLLAAIKRPMPAAVAKPTATAAAGPTNLLPPAYVPATASAPLTAKPAVATPTIDGTSTDTYRKVQQGLNLSGYGPIPVDGKAGKDTADAIRRYELENGLAVTGVPSDALIKRLAASGAIATR